MDNNITEWRLLKVTKNYYVFQLVENESSKDLKDKLQENRPYYIEFSKIKFTNGDENGT